MGLTEISLAVNVVCLLALGWIAYRAEGRAQASAREAYDAGVAIDNLSSDLWSSRDEARRLRRENLLLSRRNVSITNELRGSDDKALTVALPDAKPSPVQWTPDSWQRTYP